MSSAETQILQSGIEVKSWEQDSTMATIAKEWVTMFVCLITKTTLLCWEKLSRFF